MRLSCGEGATCLLSSRKYTNESIILFQVSNSKFIVQYVYRPAVSRTVDLALRSRSSGLSNLDPLACPFIIASQHRPARSVRLGQRQFQLGAQHAELRLLRVNRRKERVCVFVSLVVGGGQIEVDRGGGEVDFCVGLVDFLKVERDIHRCGRLVEVVSALLATATATVQRNQIHTLTSLTQPSPLQPASSSRQKDASSSRCTPAYSKTRQTPAPASCSTTIPYSPRGKQAVPDDARISPRPARSTYRTQRRTLSSGKLHLRGSQPRGHRTRALQELASRVSKVGRQRQGRALVVQGQVEQPVVQGVTLARVS